MASGYDTVSPNGTGENQSPNTPQSPKEQLDQLHEDLISITTRIDLVLEEILSNNTPDKKLFDELEQLEERETEIVLDKQRIREDLIAKKAEAVFNAEEKEKRRFTLSRKMSSFIIQEKKRLMSTSEYDPVGFTVETGQWEINPEDITIDNNQKLGTGQFGTVYIGKLKGKEVAVKKLLVQSFNDSKVEEEFKREVKIMSSLRHPNLLLFMGACTKPGSLMMVTEVMARGSVYDLLHTKDVHKKLEFREKLLIAKGTAQGMSWLHQMKPAILHLDLKTANLLVDDHGIVKVADFGLSQVKREKNNDRVGSPLYMAPEMLRGENYTGKADVYSFGICLWELITEKDPYEGAITSIQDLIQQVAVLHKRPNIPDGTLSRYRDLMNACWDPRPENRPDFHKMLKDNVFDEIILEHSIGEANQKGRQFWKMMFPGKWVVPWITFLKAISQFCRWYHQTVEDLDVKLKCLQSSLRADSQGREVVTIENYGAMLDWFGPLDSKLLDRISELYVRPDFWGFISTLDADKTLDSKAGTYLIRFSNSERGVYTVSAITKDGKVANMRVQYHVSTGKYTFGPKDYDSLQAIVNGKQIKFHNVSIKKPCQHDRPLAKLFANSKVSMYLDPNYNH